MDGIYSSCHQISFMVAARSGVEAGENKWLTNLQKTQSLQKNNNKKKVSLFN